MFIETLKNIVITLVTILIFISAVELISPNNKMKKYIQFILGLILVTVILNPILEFVLNGEKSAADKIQNYEKVVFSDLNKNNLEQNNSFENKEEIRKKSFVENLNKNCDSLLENQYKDMTFKSEIECDVNFSEVTFDVKKLKIGVDENKINPISKISINNSVQSSANEEDSKYADIINFISNELKITKEKIEVYKLVE